MKFNVHELPKAKADKRHIFEWLFERSPHGAAAWLDAYDKMIERLGMAADALPLARKVHFALLSILYEQSHPFQNPIGFTWRELARRMGVSHAGNKIDRFKEAIRSIHGIVITTECALKSGQDKTPLPEREHGYHLYSDVVFYRDVLPDGTIADRNYVWFAEWYLANLNSFYAAPINYALWTSLNERSTIASRLPVAMRSTFRPATSTTARASARA